MQNEKKSVLAHVKQFATDHKVAITATVTAAVTTGAMILVHRSAVKEWNEFLDERGLTTEFYTHLDPNN